MNDTNAILAGDYQPALPDDDAARNEPWDRYLTEACHADGAL